METLNETVAAQGRPKRGASIKTHFPTSLPTQDVNHTINFIHVVHDNLYKARYHTKVWLMVSKSAQETLAVLVESCQTRCMAAMRQCEHLCPTAQVVRQRQSTASLWLLISHLEIDSRLLHQ